MIVIVDTREQTPFDFGRFPDVEVTRATLITGDYSLAGSSGNLPGDQRFTDSVCLSRELSRTSAVTTTEAR